MSEETEIKFIKINGARDYIDVMYNDVKPIEKGYQVHLQYDGYDIKRVIEYFYKIEQENQQLKEENENLNHIIDKQDRDITTISKGNKKLNNGLAEIKEYVIKHRQIYDIDGSIEKQIDEFDILASPKRILQIIDKVKE